jgi:drug/metabolite transporter (DMT)-like permease
MHPGRNDYLLLLMLGAVWGFSFLLIKLAVATIPPLTVAAGRICLGAALLLLVAIIRGAPLRQLRASWLPLLAMGGLGTVLPFFLISWGETRIDSGLAAILMSATPLYTIILAHFLVAGEPLTVGKVAGVALGFAGMVVLVGPSALSGLGGVLVAQLAVAVAPLCYAGNSIVARRLPPMPPELVGAGMLLAATIIGLPASLLIDRPWELAPSGLSLLAVIGLGVVCTAFGYLLLFRIIAGAGAGFSSFNNYLVPLFGLLWGALLLGERPEPRALIALLLIFAGIAAPRLWPGRLRRAATLGGSADYKR